jgi:hypothetical protein
MGMSKKMLGVLETQAEKPPIKGHTLALVSATFRNLQVYITELYGDTSFCIAMVY